ncbi:MAG: preprotein translocase subunit SecY [Gammaproteobacteria bacterium]|nr:preprotein translocase subunit SecY [Gammaproteobacteria bacterium]
MATPNLGSALSQGGLAELKRRLLFVLMAIIVFRIGSHVPVPGLDPERLAHLFSQSQGGIFGMFNMFSGGAFQRATVLALGVMPYISSSIIMQLFTAVVPKLEQLKKEGESGRRVINQYTRYGTVILSFFQAVGMSKWLASNGIPLELGFSFYFIATISMVTGTMFLMWLGEQMTERGVGNGISLLIFAGIVSRFPEAIAQVFTQVKQGQMQGISLLLLLVLVLLVTGFVVFVERAQRRITVNYAKRQQGRRVYAAQKSHLPFKINMAGVIPPIFASSLIFFPSTIAGFFADMPSMHWLQSVSIALSPGQPLYLAAFTAAIFFFCFFYTAMVFNPNETAENLKKSGAFIPGIRPGEQTARYIDSVMTRLTFVGAIYLTAVALMPEFLILKWHVPFHFGGTSLLITVVVLMDFWAQLQAHLMSHQYESLMKKANLKGGHFGLSR